MKTRRALNLLKIGSYAVYAVCIVILYLAGKPSWVAVLIGAACFVSGRIVQVSDDLLELEKGIRTEQKEGDT